MASTADYTVVIRDLKARRDVLDAAIVALERVLPVVSGGAAHAINPYEDAKGSVFLSDSYREKLERERKESAERRISEKKAEALEGK